MKRRTSLLLVLGLVFSIVLGIVGWTTVSVQAQTQPNVSSLTEQPVIQAQLPAAQAKPAAERITTPKDDGISAQNYPYYPDAALCYTCGGTYPYYTGQIDLLSGSTPREYGVGCSGSLRYIYDSAPRICSN